jgi:23S rRNA G2445 N2-methylase RlmL
MVFPGLEEVAAEEIAAVLGGDVRKTGPGFVVFRVDEITPALLRLRTVEDVFLLAWGTDQLTHRATDLDRIERWTARDADWQNLLRLHHGVRPRPTGKPTYHLVTQMTGKHVYMRKHARQALARGLRHHLPASWRLVEEDASVEVWLTITGPTAFCGLRLSDKLMRHRDYKIEHLPASLRPSIAASMVRLAGIYPGVTLADPMCGAGTILAEAFEGLRGRGQPSSLILGGDVEKQAVRAAETNLRRFGPALLSLWDARRLPLADASLDRIVSNPPFGVQLGTPEQVEQLYAEMMSEYDRVLTPEGRAVLLVSDQRLLDRAGRARGWQSTRRVGVRVLGQRATISVWKKSPPSGTKEAVGDQPSAFSQKGPLN